MGDRGTVGFVGLGNMGAPMAGRLARAGYAVRGHDADAASLTVLDELPGAVPVPTAAAVAEGADAVVLMLPTSDVVEAVLDGGLRDALAPGTVLVDMGSSDPVRTRALAPGIGERGAALVDAPVSGGVAGARNGTLTIMAGGDPEPVERVRPLLEALGGKVLHVGPVAAGHALKALNNLMSAAHLLVSSEALEAGHAFGLDYEVMLEAVNGSSGRSGSTQVKWPAHVLPGGFDSGFGLGLMLKDMRTAVGLAAASGRPARLGAAAVDLWAEAARELPGDADHTEIVRWLRNGEQR
ncbi:NAD(P)-dependent oxidoreductase [Actinomadura welshii]|uniref:NAD(P)-dependent oxidoreductase n=1 Tax=Actinomadura welshii TaxID=3103817 RepID=UPI0003ACF80B|nr:NAD(P)-dependent oxidoreductase [Actinomadura madurae]